MGRVDALEVNESPGKVTESCLRETCLPGSAFSYAPFYSRFPLFSSPQTLFQWYRTSYLIYFSNSPWESSFVYLILSYFSSSVFHSQLSTYSHLLVSSAQSSYSVFVLRRKRVFPAFSMRYFFQ